MNFPGVTTQWKSYLAQTPGAWEQSYSTAAHAEAAYIAREIASVRDAGVDLADEALVFIDEAAGFSVENAPNIIYTPPTQKRAALYGGVDVPLFTTASLSELIGDVKTEAFDTSAAQTNVSKPLKGSLVTKDEPLSNIDVYKAVTPPSLGTYSPPTPVTLTFDIQDGTYAPPGHVVNAYTPLSFDTSSGVDITIGAFIEPEESPLADIQADQLDAKLTDLQSYLGSFAVVSAADYEPLDLQVASLVGNMLNGSMDFTEETITSADQRFATIQVSHNDALSTALVTYGSPGDASPYLQRRQSRKEAEQLVHEAASRAKFRLELVAAGLALAGQLYVAVLRRRQQLIEIEVKALEAQLEVARELNEATKNAYQARMSIYSAQIRAQRVVYEIAAQKAAQHKIEVRKQQIIADKANQEYSAYATREGAKVSVLQSLQQIAATNAARSRVFVLEKQLEAKSAQARAELAMSKQKSAILEWTTSLDNLREKLASYQARAQTVSAANSVQTSRQQVVDANYGRLEAEARRVATKASAELTDVSFTATSRRNKLLQQGTNNQIFQVKQASHNERRETSYAHYGTQIATAGNVFRAKVEQNQAAAQFYSAASQSLGRAANLSQRANIDLATAYTSIQETVGRAYAAIENGRLSGWSAASTLSAQGSLSASASSGRTVSTSYSTQTSEGDQESEQVSVSG